MDLQLKEKVIITGGAKGIGVAIVRSCAGEGAVPVIVGRDTEAGRHLQKELQRGGTACGLITLDLSTPESCLQAVEQVLQTFGCLDTQSTTQAVTTRSDSNMAAPVTTCHPCTAIWCTTTAWPIMLCRT